MFENRAPDKMGSTIYLVSSSNKALKLHVDLTDRKLTLEVERPDGVSMLYRAEDFDEALSEFERL